MLANDCFGGMLSQLGYCIDWLQAMLAGLVCSCAAPSGLDQQATAADVVMFGQHCTGYQCQHPGGAAALLPQGHGSYLHPCSPYLYEWSVLSDAALFICVCAPVLQLLRTHKRLQILTAFARGCQHRIRHSLLMKLCGMSSASIITVSCCIGLCPFFWHAVLQDHARKAASGTV